MKKIQVLAVAACVLAIGSAFASKNVAHKSTNGKFWDASAQACVSGSTTFDCTTSVATICTDDATGSQLRDGSSNSNPCGNLLYHQ